MLFIIFKPYDDHQAPTTEPSIVERAAPAAAVVAAIVALAPPPISMFPPQGAPQSGSGSQSGGGVTPVQGVLVRKTAYIFMKV